MNAHELIIEFRGICTHFRNAVPGVPHRVVIPPTRSYYPGAFQTPMAESEELYQVPFAYLLEPHLASMYVLDEDEQIGLIDDVKEIATGWFSMSALRFRISNATDPYLKYPVADLPEGEHPFDRLPRLTDFVKNYRSSNAVLLGAYAQGYFDIYGGTVTVYPSGGALRTRVRIQTDGPPRLSVTPLEMQQPSARWETELPPGKLIVANTSMGCKADASVDYLWHLSTAQAGIPRFLTQPPYGFRDDARAAGIDRDALAKRFRELLELGYPGTVDLPLNDFSERLASCSNSQWP